MKKEYSLPKCVGIVDFHVNVKSNTLTIISENWDLLQDDSIVDNGKQFNNKK